MIMGIIKDIALMFGEHLDDQIQKLSLKMWHVAFCLGLLLIAIVMITLGLVFFGVSLYKSMNTALGPELTPMVLGCFFLLFGVFVVIISKKFIKKN